jgi:putative aldouronate transport system substrate-binding protein
MNPMKERAKWVSVLCAASLITVMAGCGSDKTSSSSSTDGKGTTAAAASATPQPIEKLKKLSIMTSLKTTEVPSDKIEKLLEEKTGTEVDIQWVPDGSYDEKFQAAFATGGLPQAAFIKNQASFMLLRDSIKNGQFWEVGPYLKDYPNLSKLSKDTLKNTSVDGKIYSLYQERPLTRQGIIYRKDWADKLGLAAPQTTDDIYNMLKKFKEADLAGGGKTLGLADRNDLVYGAFKTLSAYFGTPNNWGVVDGKIVPEFMTQGYMDTMKFMKKLRDEGLINQDFPVTSKTDQQNFMYTGKAGMYIGSMPDVETMQDKTSKNVKDAIYDVTNVVKGKDGKQVTWALPGYGTLVMFPKTAVKNEKELKQILAFFDQLWSPDLANLLKYGIENEHYTMKDGKVVPGTDLKLFEKDVKAYQSIGLADSTNIKPSTYTFPSVEKAFKLSEQAIPAGVQDPTLPLDSKTYNEKGSRLAEAMKDATYQFMMGKIDEKGFNDAVKKWQDDGGTKIMEEFTTAYKALAK